MDFTREPVIETVVTPKEGCKIVVRSSKNAGQEEFFVDAIEVVSFGNAIFYRSLERPKPFLVPASDYEILEVRETRMVLKNVGLDRSIKIGGGRESNVKHVKEAELEKATVASDHKETTEVPTATVADAKATDPRLDKKRDRRRQYRKRRGKDEPLKESDASEEIQEGELIESKDHSDSLNTSAEETKPAEPVMTPAMLSALLAPPTTLISDTIARYKDNLLYKDAFYVKDEEKDEDEEEKSEDSEQVDSGNDEEVPETYFQDPFQFLKESVEEREPAESAASTYLKENDEKIEEIVEEKKEESPEHKESDQEHAAQNQNEP